MSVPGALEVPLALQILALERRGFQRRYDALVALGAVVRGQTQLMQEHTRDRSAALLSRCMEAKGFRQAR